MSSDTHLPRILGLVLFIALLYGVNLVAPRIVPSILGLLVLYAVVTHADRALALLGTFDAKLSGLIAPAPAGGGGGGRVTLR